MGRSKNMICNWKISRTKLTFLFIDLFIYIGGGVEHLNSHDRAGEFRGKQGLGKAWMYVIKALNKCEHFMEQKPTLLPNYYLVFEHAFWYVLMIIYSFR